MRSSATSCRTSVSRDAGWNNSAGKSARKSPLKPASPPSSSTRRRPGMKKRSGLLRESEREWLKVRRQLVRSKNVNVNTLLMHAARLCHLIEKEKRHELDQGERVRRVPDDPRPVSQATRRRGEVLRPRGRGSSLRRHGEIPVWPLAPSQAVSGGSHPPSLREPEP